RAKRALLQPEPSPLHIGAEILALRHGIVTGLLLAPAVLFRLAEAGDIALSAVGEDAIAPLVVGAHLLVRRIGVAVTLCREAVRRSGRLAEANAGARAAIQSWSFKSALMWARIAAFSTMRMSRCCRSLFDGDDRQALRAHEEGFDGLIRKVQLVGQSIHADDL